MKQINLVQFNKLFKSTKQLNSEMEISWKSYMYKFWSFLTLYIPFYKTQLSKEHKKVVNWIICILEFSNEMKKFSIFPIIQSLKMCSFYFSIFCCVLSSCFLYSKTIFYCWMEKSFFLLFSWILYLCKFVQILQFKFQMNKQKICILLMEKRIFLLVRKRNCFALSKKFQFQWKFENWHSLKSFKWFHLFSYSLCLKEFSRDNFDIINTTKSMKKCFWWWWWWWLKIYAFKTSNIFSRKQLLRDGRHA